MHFKKSNKETLSIQDLISVKCKQFFQHSTIHGVYYFWSSSSWWIRLTWCCGLAASLALCGFLSHVIWSKFIVDPTFTVVESTRYPLEKVPFPAVSICDPEMVYRPNTDNITRILSLRTFNLSQIDEFYDSFSNIKDKNYRPAAYIKKMHGVLEDLGFTYDVLLDQMKQPCDTILQRCVWRSMVHDCADMFRQVFSLVGYCCQFDISYFRRHVKNDTNFVSGVEITEALDITVKTRKDDDGSSDGYMSLYVFERHDILTLLDSSISITPATYFDVSLSVWVIDSTSDVKALSIQNRKCFLKEDSGINAISYQDCMTRLIMKKVVEFCRCLPFRYNSEDLGVENFPRCGWSQYACVYQNIERVQSNIRSLISQEDCHQRCDYVQYTTEVEYLKWGRDLREQSKGFSRVTVHFSDDTCMKYRREVLYTWDQMLANLGGIFGLCLGGSLISIIEILWFILDLFFAIVFACYEKIARRMKIGKRNVKIARKKHFASKISSVVVNKRIQFNN